MKLFRENKGGRRAVPGLFFWVLLVWWFGAVQANADEAPVLKNNEITVTLEAARQYLPVSAQTAAGLNVFKAGETGFQISLRVLCDDGSSPGVLESQTGWLKFFGKAEHSQTALKSTTVIKGGTCTVTRKISLPEKGSSIQVQYEVEIVKSFTIAYGTWSGLHLAFPEFKLSPDFDRFFEIAFEEEKLQAVLKDGPPMISTRAPYWSPVFAASSKHKSMVLIIPTVMEGCEILTGGMPVKVPEGHKFKVGFSIEVKPLMKAEELSDWLNQQDKGPLKIGLGQNLYQAAKAARKTKEMKKAETSIVEAARRNPRDIHLLNILGYVGQDTKNVRLMIEAWPKAAVLAPDSQRFAEWGVNVMLKAIEQDILPREKLNEALELTTTRLKLNPKDAMLRSTHARVFAALGKYPEAAEHMQIARENLKGTKEDVKWRSDMWARELADFQKKAEAVPEKEPGI